MTMEFLGFELMNIISWIAVGAFIALLVGMMDQGRVKGGTLMTIIYGILGSIIAGVVASVVFNINPREFEPLLLAISAIGALAGIILHRLVYRDTSHIKTQTTRLE